MSVIIIDLYDSSNIKYDNNNLNTLITSLIMPLSKVSKVQTSISGGAFWVKVKNLRDGHALNIFHISKSYRRGFYLN